MYICADGFSFSKLNTGRGRGHGRGRTQEYGCLPSNVLTNGANIFDRATTDILVLFIKTNVPREDDIGYYLGVVAA